MKVAHFVFAPELQDLLRRDLREQAVELRFQGPQSVKHLIESLRIPHTEIGELKANGLGIDLRYIVMDGDRVEAWPVPPARNATEEPRFVLDLHLGRLASHLRMLGLDCLYRNSFEDQELVQLSVEGGRILLTRDRLLLMHKVITQGYLLRSMDATEQLREVIVRYNLREWVKPFQRCMRCNHPLESVAKETILEKLEPLTKKYYHEFKLCPACDQVYWKGSHYERMLALIREVSPSL
jgi:uncharacterized protein with PIN domain